eukprot:216469-Hanusia_phi.AAC.1
MESGVGGEVLAEAAASGGGKRGRQMQEEVEPGPAVRKMREEGQKARRDGLLGAQSNRAGGNQGARRKTVGQAEDGLGF